MIITISGPPGSGKGVVGKILSEKLGYAYYSMGDIRRKYAEENNMTIEELNKKAEHDPYSDKLADNYQKELAKKEDNLIIDSKLGFYFIPDSFKIFLDADETIRARRIFNHGRPTEKYASVNEAIEKMRIRQESDKRRYEKLYDFKISDSEDNFDFVIDTSDKTPEEIVETIINSLPKPL